ncbi:MAG: hypothetical protein R6V50_01710 [Thermoplasmatota archaeon]
MNFFSFNSKKGQGLSLNVVVIAALALIVLVVLTAIFAGKIRESSQSGEKSTQEFLGKVCEQDGGRCVDNYQSGQDEGEFIDCGEDQYCEK